MKKEKTAKQEQLRLSSLSKLSFAAEFISAFLPYGIMALIYADEWFVTDSAWKVTTGGILALCLVGLTMFLISKNKIKDSLLPLCLGWFATSFILFLLSDIINQMAMIMLFGGLGLAGAYGLDIVSKDLAKKSSTYKEAINDANKDIIKEQAKEEIKKTSKISKLLNEKVERK